jgi:hypothetical protein
MRYVQAEVRRICGIAGLPADITFTSFRHGGHTDGGDSGLSDAQLRALGGHKTTAACGRQANRQGENASHRRGDRGPSQRRRLP